MLNYIILVQKWLFQVMKQLFKLTIQILWKLLEPLIKPKASMKEKQFFQSSWKFLMPKKGKKNKESFKCMIGLIWGNWHHIGQCQNLLITDKNVSRHSKYYQKLYFVLLHNLQMDYKSTIKTTKHLFSFNISLGNSNVKSKNETFVESWRLCYNFLYRRKSVHWWNSPTRQRGIICLYVLQYLQSFDCIYDIL